MGSKIEILLKNIKIFDKTHPLYLKTTDISIDKSGTIISTAKNQGNKATRVINHKGLCVSPGWFDFGVHSGEPGHEERENFDSLGKAAARGGYTCIAIFPNTTPSLDNRSMIEYVENATKRSPVLIKTIGAISKGCEGLEMADILDMNQGGVIAYSDGSIPVKEDSLMLKVLEYGKKIDTLIINQPLNTYMSSPSYVNEGIVSIGLGLRGDPKISEHLMISRDIDLLAYSGGRLLSHLISSEESVKRVKIAKAKKLPIRCSVSYMHLTESDDKLSSFDVNYKINPPLRTQGDRKSLVKGILSGTIDAIVSNHTPVELDSKDCEFGYAQQGAIGLETCFAQLNTVLDKELGLEYIVEVLSSSNRRSLGMEVPQIKKNEMAELTLFCPEENWTYEQNNISSVSVNSPYINVDFNGKVFGIYANRKLSLNK